MGSVEFNGTHGSDPVGESIRIFVAELLGTTRVRLTYHPVGGQPQIDESRPDEVMVAEASAEVHPGWITTITVGFSERAGARVESFPEALLAVPAAALRAATVVRRCADGAQRSAQPVARAGAARHRRRRIAEPPPGLDEARVHLDRTPRRHARVPDRTQRRPRRVAQPHPRRDHHRRARRRAAPLGAVPGRPPRREAQPPAVRRHPLRVDRRPARSGTHRGAGEPTGSAAPERRQRPDDRPRLRRPRFTRGTRHPPARRHRVLPPRGPQHLDVPRRPAVGDPPQ